MNVVEDLDLSKEALDEKQKVKQIVLEVVFEKIEEDNLILVENVVRTVEENYVGSKVNLVRNLHLEPVHLDEEVLYLPYYVVNNETYNLVVEKVREVYVVLVEKTFGV